ncbi:hypothetical protein EYF80_003208 [Liparis tanakae]|uniref:Uncharacterized protein n=1 Tax=Liparis tanakae TaxID=230148 RepID=A0A4Z2J9S8_9TELE|nr:hypothetical protein EYF80_003208 [Liparis tanakae]
MEGWRKLMAEERAVTETLLMMYRWPILNEASQRLAEYIFVARAVPAERVRKKRKATWKPNQSTMPPARALNVSFPSTSRVARKL